MIRSSPRGLQKGACLHRLRPRDRSVPTAVLQLVGLEVMLHCHVAPALHLRPNWALHHCQSALSVWPSAKGSSCAREMIDTLISLSIRSPGFPLCCRCTLAAAAETSSTKLKHKLRTVCHNTCRTVRRCVRDPDRKRGLQGPHLARRRGGPADAFDQTASVDGDAELVRIPPSVRCTLPALAGVPLRHPRCRQPMPQASQLLWHGQGLHCAHRRHLDGPSSMLCGFSLQASSCA